MPGPTFAPETPAAQAQRVFAAQSGRDAKTVVDASVTQGNRLKTAEQTDPTTPQAKLEAKIDAGFNEGMNLLADLRAGADQLEALLNKLRVGF